MSFKSYTIYKIGWGVEPTWVEAWVNGKEEAYKRMKELQSQNPWLIYYIVEKR